MASEDEELKTKNGIEASDLASLLCRFEEATSSVPNLNKCVQKKRDNLMEVSISRNIPDLTLSSTIPTQGGNAANEMKGDKTVHSVSQVIKSTYVDSDFIESLKCQTESMIAATTLTSVNTESSLPFKFIDPSETEVNSQLIMENLDNLSKETFQHSGNSSTNASRNLSRMKEVGLQDTVSKCNTLTGGNLQKYKPTATLTKSTVSSFASASQSEMYLQIPVLSTASDIHESSNGLTKSALVQENPIILFGSDATSGNITERFFQEESNLKSDDSSICLEPSSDAENHRFHQPATEFTSYDIENSDIFNGSDHSYCSKKLKNVTEVLKSECAKAALKNTLYQEKTFTLDNGEPSEDLTDIFFDHSSKSKRSDELILEEGEIFVDSDGNELFYHFESQPSDIVRCDEATIKTTDKNESRKRPHSCLQHKEFINGPTYEDTCAFFDKIPLYYTALSIPSKPVTTTVFASTTKAIGSTDHLDFLDASEPIDEGHYDKVPAHRRCFTNTTKEVEIKLEGSEVQNSLSNNMTMQTSFQNCSHENNLSIPNKSVQLRSTGNLAITDVKRTSRSHSPYSKIPGRRSRSLTRRSGSASRFSRRSASSMSDCSTCSLCSSSSGCSTCSGVSRSPSLSGSERDSSLCSDYRRTRSRSRDPSRGSRNPAKRTRHHFTPLRRQSRSRTISPSEDSTWRLKQSNYRGRKNSTMTEKKKIKEEEQVKAMEERRIVYVGKIPNGYTKKQLYQRFQSFGEIKEVKVNFREHGDNYGFVTFAYACDAVAAKEKGNSNQGEVKFDLCFGGRRHFCPDQYSDLDGNCEIEEEYAPMSRNLTQDLDYTALLKLHSTHQKKK